MSVSGPYFTFAQLEALWINNGGPTAVADIAAAIALAESNGGMGSINPTDNNGTQTSWGGWQISNGTHNQPVPNILDPNVNAQQAVRKYQGARNSFAPWGTYGSGAYLGRLQHGVPPSNAGVPVAGSAAAVGAAAAGDLGGGGSATTAADSSTIQTCLISVPDIPIIGGGGCLITKTQARAVVGAGVLVAGAVLGLVALIVLVRGVDAVPAAAAAALRPVRRPTAPVAAAPAEEPEPEPDEDEDSE